MKVWRRLRRRSRAKVFGLGLSRTGTKSLTAALARLGLDVAHYPDDPTTVRELLAGHCELTLLRERDGITDITTIPFYREFDRIYPDSRFVLTVREKDAWLESLRKLLERRPPGDEPARYRDRPELVRFRRFLRERVYGSNEFDAERMAAAYDAHHREVRAYFEGRPDDLLVLDVTRGEGYDRLCPFLGVGAPDEPFPVEGRSVDADARRARVAART